jgi:hypothetical protein
MERTVGDLPLEGSWRSGSSRGGSAVSHLLQLSLSMPCSTESRLWGQQGPWGRLHCGEAPATVMSVLVAAAAVLMPVHSGT